MTAWRYNSYYKDNTSWIASLNKGKLFGPGLNHGTNTKWQVSGKHLYLGLSCLFVRSEMVRQKKVNLEREKEKNLLLDSDVLKWGYLITDHLMNNKLIILQHLLVLRGADYLSFILYTLLWFKKFLKA